MRHASHPSVGQYHRVGLQTAVLSADPAQLIALLMDAALAAMRRAALLLEAGNVQERGAAISKAIEIVDSGLKASLQPGQSKAQASLAENLTITYDAIVHHLLQANRSASAQSLELAQTLLGNLRDAWKDATGAVGVGG